MKNKYIVKLSAMIIALVLTSSIVKAQSTYTFDSPMTKNFVIEFDMYATANWSDFYIKPPVGDDHAEDYFQMKLLFGGGDITHYNGDHSGGLVAADGYLLETKYNFKIYMVASLMKQTVMYRVDGDTEWITLFDNEGWAYGYVPVGRIILPQANITLENVTATNIDGKMAWEFNTDGDTETWYKAAKISTISATGGNLESIIDMMSMGNPIITAATPGVDITTNTHLKVNMKNTTSASKMNILFMSSLSPVGDDNIPEIQSLEVAITPNSEFTVYTIDMSQHNLWGGELYNLGIEIVDPTDGSFAVDYLRIGTEASLPTAKYSKIKFEVYPNPVIDRLNISSDNEIMNVKVFAINGAELINIDTKSKKSSINVSELNSGIYLVKIETVLGISSKRFIK